MNCLLTSSSFKNKILFKIPTIPPPKIDEITRDDLNICYIGRIDKSYVKAVFEGVSEFIRKHPDRSIQFVIVGAFTSQKQVSEFKKTFAGLTNARIKSVGNLVPIPRKLFEKVDVVIAGAQTAIFCAYEKVPVITAVVDKTLTPGVLFIDTDDAWYDDSPNQISYCEALERVLIKKAYKNRKPKLPKRYPADYHYERTLDFQLKIATQPLEYFTERFKSCKTPSDWIAQFPFHCIQHGAKIVIYMAGKKSDKITTDYIRQIRDGRYCKLVGIVSDNHENYDDSVVAPERLNEIQYDGIVIAGMIPQDQLDAITQKIVNITGKRNYVYDFKDIVVL